MAHFSAPAFERDLPDLYIAAASSYVTYLQGQKFPPGQEKLLLELRCLLAKTPPVSYARASAASSAQRGR